LIWGRISIYINKESKDNLGKDINNFEVGLKNEKKVKNGKSDK
jgi:hypothetical protein